MKRDKVLYQSGDWSLQPDEVNRESIASIRHKCPDMEYSVTTWFHSPYGISECACGEVVPEDIQCLCVLFNMEWLKRSDYNGKEKACR